MGICQGKRATKKQNHSPPTSVFSTDPNIIQQLECFNQKQGALKTIPHMTSLHEIAEYDPQNPHRQFNVMVNGVLFQVMNSLEQSLQDNGSNELF